MLISWLRGGAAGCYPRRAGGGRCAGARRPAGKPWGMPMSSYELWNRLPVAPALIVLVALIAYGPFSLYMRNRDRKGVRSQIVLYALLAGLFLIDFFLILKRDGFHASWSLSFWLALAAFM